MSVPCLPCESLSIQHWINAELLMIQNSSISEIACTFQDKELIYIVSRDKNTDIYARRETFKNGILQSVYTVLLPV